MTQKASVFLEILRSNIVQITFALMGVTGLALGTYITVRLTPLVEGISNLANRVSAIEKSLDGRPALVERFIITEQQTKQILGSIEEIKESQLRMENKVDRISER